MSKKNKPSLCWSCQRAVLVYGKACSWAMDFKPVDGWTAIPHKLNISVNSRYKVVQSYHVIDCPLYMPDVGTEGHIHGKPDPTWNGIE